MFYFRVYSAEMGIYDSFRLPDHCSVYQAEITSIQEAMMPNTRSAVCCGVRGRALASHTDVRGFESQCGGRLSSLTC